MATQQARQPITLEGRRIHFRNFAGVPTRFNVQGGVRDFVVFLEDEEAKAMEQDGWNIKYLKARDEDDQPAPILRVKLKWPKGESRARPPRVILITSRGKTQLDETTVDLLDWADIDNVDMIIRPWEWTINGNSGVTAYLNSIYVTIREDELEKKYMDTPDYDGGFVAPQPDEAETPF